MGRAATIRPAAAKREDDKASGLDLTAFLPYRLNVLAASVSLSLSKVYAERFGIGVPEWRVLATLGQRGEMTARDIGAFTCMHKTKVSRAIAALEGKGLLSRRASKGDRREVIAALTDAGRATYRELAPMALSFARDLEAVLSPEERRILDRAVAKLQARAAHLNEAFDGAVFIDEGDEA